MQSGYAMYLSIDRYKNKSFTSFYTTRINGLLLDFLIVSILYIICYSIVDGFSFSQIINDISHGSTTHILPYSWFIIELIVLYILSYIAFKTRYPIIVASLLSFLCIAALYVAGFGCEWWMSTMAFPFGMAVKHIEKYNLHKGILYILPTAITISLLTLYMVDHNIIVWLTSIICISYVVNVLVARCINPIGMFKYLSDNSIYIYIYQGFSINFILKNTYYNGCAYVAIVILSTIAFAHIYSATKRFIINENRNNNILG